MALYELSPEMASRAGEALADDRASSRERSLAGHVLDQAAEIERLRLALARSRTMRAEGTIADGGAYRNRLAGPVDTIAGGAHRLYR